MFAIIDAPPARIGKLLAAVSHAVPLVGEPVTLVSHAISLGGAAALQP